MTQLCDHCGELFQGVPWKARWDWVDLLACSESCIDKAFEHAVYPYGEKNEDQS